MRNVLLICASCFTSEAKCWVKRRLTSKPLHNRKNTIKCMGTAKPTHNFAAFA
jgi:hypothetical protein